MSDFPEQGLIARVRRAELNFERLVEVLSAQGYVTDLEEEPGLEFGRVAMNNAHQKDFDALFEVLMPGRLNDINILAIATDQAACPDVPPTRCSTPD